MTKKKQYDLKEMEKISALLAKQVQLLERVKELMREIAEFKAPPQQIFYPPIYLPPYTPPVYPTPWIPPFTYGTADAPQVGEEVRYEIT
jgi:hypothetical protein